MRPALLPQSPLESPCLFLSGPEWERLPERLEDPFLAQLQEANLVVLAGMPEDPEDFAKRSAGWGNSNLPCSRALRAALTRSTVAWYLTRDEHHLDYALRALDFACERAPWVAGPGANDGLRGADLATGEMLYCLAFAYDALHPYLDSARRDACLDAIVDKGLAHYMTGVELEDWWVRCDFNWNPALHANAALAALAIAGQRPEVAARAMAMANEGLPYLMPAFLPGGGYIEGLLYLDTTLGHLTDFVAAYHRVTGDDLGLCANRNLADTLTFRRKMVGGDEMIYNFSDAHERPPRPLPQVFWWARALGRPDLAAQEDLWRPSTMRRGLFNDIETFWYREPGQAAEQAPPTRLDHYPSLDWLTWRGEQTWFAFRSGSNGGNHDNDDLGNLILGHGGERFLIDPGYGAAVASQHNCPTVRRREQTDGATAQIDCRRQREAGD
jgi:hypothetical protein